MALQTKVGSFAQNTSTGNQAISGLGFTPKIILFFSNDLTADGSASNSNIVLGVGLSSTNRVSVQDLEKNGNTGDLGRRSTVDVACIKYFDELGNPVVVADFVSLDSDGFTINWTTADANARIINYLAIGGTDLTNVNMIEKTSPTATGSQAYTGMGFQADCVMILAPGVASGNNSAASGQFSLGVGMSSSNRFALGGGQKNGNNPTVNSIQQVATKIVNNINNSVFLVADLTSIDADGLTLNWTQVQASARYFYVIGFKGARFAIGTETQPTTNGTKATSGLGFQPTGLLVFSGNQAHGTGIQANERITIGAASDTTHRGNVWSGATNNVATTVAKQNLDRSTILRMITEGTTPTVNASADLSSFDSDGFTFNWTATDATAREFIYFAIGSQPTTTKTLTGISRITATVLQTILGKSKINITTLQTILGKGALTGTSVKTLQGLSRMTATKLQTLTGKANITSGSAYPTASSATTTKFDTQATSMPVNLPASISAGDLLIAFTMARYDQTWSPPAGWNLLFNVQAAGTGRFACWYKIADGTEGSTATWGVGGSGSTASWQVRKITNWHGTTPPEVATASSAGVSQNDPPSLTPSWGSANNLWLAIMGDTAQAINITVAPTNYSNLATNPASSTGTACNTGSAYRQLATGSEDPGSFTTDTDHWWAAATIAVRPAGNTTNQTLTGLARITKSTVQTILGKARVTAITTQTIAGKAKIICSATANMINRILLLDGSTGYATVPDDDDFSITKTGAITVSLWIKLNSLDFNTVETVADDTYVNFLGKSEYLKAEWQLRIRNKTSYFPNRVSFYTFNPDGQEGMGSYFQDTLATGVWIHIVGSSDMYQNQIYRDGTKRNSIYFQTRGTPATLTANISGGQVTSINIVNGGTGYKAADGSGTGWGPYFNCYGGGGANAYGICHITNGVIESFDFWNNGSGYTSAPSVAVGITPVNTTSILGMGRCHDTDAYFNGAMDDVRIYNRILTDDEISDLFSAGRGGGGTADGLIHRWKYDETTGTTAYDEIGTLNATLYGGASFGPDNITSLQTILGKSRITVVALKTLTGIARITISSTRTLLGKSRITINTLKTIQGIARITASTTKTILGKARIMLITPKTILGKARLTATGTQTLLGKAYILVQGTTAKTIQGVARITASTSKTMLGKSRITALATQTILGKSSLAITTIKTILGKARITVSTTQTILGKARIQLVTLKTLSGKVRITANALQTILGKSRLTSIAPRTIQGIAKITTNTIVNKTILGKAQITAISLQTILGKARITSITSRAIQGVSRVTSSIGRTINGISRLTIVSLQHITGKSSLATISTQTIVGRAKILPFSHGSHTSVLYTKRSNTFLRKGRRLSVLHHRGK